MTQILNPSSKSRYTVRGVDSCDVPNDEIIGSEHFGLAGEFGLAPVTKHKTVTTTTTTTMSIAPFLLRPITSSKTRNFKEFPLACTATPESLQKLEFNIGGQAVTFHEKIQSQDTHTNITRSRIVSANLDRRTERSIVSPARRIQSIGPAKTTGQKLARPILATSLQLDGNVNDDTNRLGIPPIKHGLPVTPDGDDEQDGQLTVNHRLSNMSHHSKQVPEEGEMEDSDIEDANPFAQHIHSLLNRPYTLQTAQQQDASLPSPSLSPVTAAQNMIQKRQAGRRLTFDNDDVSDLSGFDAEPVRKRKLPPSFETRESAAGLGIVSGPSNQCRTVMEVPEMISMFDSLPSRMQDYVMFHLLKRCSRPTLRMVFGMVAPVLKRDPVANLPLEMSLKIIRFLDGKSLAKAAQVSKRWRQVINSDETGWRNLIITEDLRLPDVELSRAITEGWGWQFEGQHGYEKDLGFITEQCSTIAVEDGDDVAPKTNSRKRRAVHTASCIAKRQKRKLNADSPSESRTRSGLSLQKDLGPITFANMAARTIPDPGIGLPSLRGLHLYKSIYQRQKMIRQAWMDSNCLPHHLAFRAHHRFVVTCLLFDSERIITGSEDKTINVFSTRTGALKARLRGHEGGVWALACVGSNMLVSGSTDRTVRIWNINTGRNLHTFQGHTSTVRCLVILHPVMTGRDEKGEPIMHPKVPIFITGSRDSTLRVWKLPSLTDPSVLQDANASEHDNPYALRTLSGHHHSVRAISAYADTLVSGSYDCTVRVWQISTGALVHRLQGHTAKVYSVVLDYERQRCVSGSLDNCVRIWSIESGACLYALEGHTSLVGLLELNHGYLVSAAADSTLRIWDPQTGIGRGTLLAHTGAITCFQHDGQKVVSGSDKTLKMWNIENGECVRDLLTDLTGVWQVRFDERRCVAAVQRDQVTYIEVCYTKL